MNVIGFKDENRIYSNFYPAAVVYEGITYKSVEYAYQAAKADSLEIRKYINSLPTPGAAKRVGGGKDPLPDGTFLQSPADWKLRSLDIMYTLVKEKFSKHADLKARLLATDGLLVEENNWGDDFWGTVNGVGRNFLGAILMRVREELRRGE